MKLIINTEKSKKTGTLYSTIKIVDDNNNVELYKSFIGLLNVAIITDKPLSKIREGQTVYNIESIESEVNE